MEHYNDWFGDDWCGETRDEEWALIDAIKNSVRDDIKQEMERLRKKTQSCSSTRRNGRKLRESRNFMNLDCKLRLRHIKESFVLQKSKNFLEIIS